ncbi:hypothetical protein ABZ934_09845 [Streptomyces sp. NPDC046557]|uniref:hypothetical protein n=1 Tax=Streptomyces sp. NPDC046557 TaxID=3155372 RepID=UPI0033E825C0
MEGVRDLRALAVAVGADPDVPDGEHGGVGPVTRRQRRAATACRNTDPGGAGGGPVLQGDDGAGVAPGLGRSGTVTATLPAPRAAR